MKSSLARERDARARTRRTIELREAGGRRGWCPECAEEGADPHHNRTSILCSRHYQRKMRSGEVPKKFKPPKGGTPGKGGWCPECEKEGDDPRHTRRSILCPKHYYRKTIATEEGRRKIRKKNARTRSVFSQVIAEQKAEPDPEET